MADKTVTKLESTYTIFKIVCGVLVGFWGFLVWTGGWLALPKRVEANEGRLVEVQKWKAEADKNFAIIAEGMDTMKEQQTEMRQDIKTLLQRGTR